MALSSNGQGPTTGSLARDALFERMDAAEWAEVFGRFVLDAQDAANYLGVERNSIEYAAYRGRIRYVHYGAKKLFAKADLDAYRDLRGRGRESRLTACRRFKVK